MLPLRILVDSLLLPACLESFGRPCSCTQCLWPPCQKVRDWFHFLVFVFLVSRSWWNNRNSVLNFPNSLDSMFLASVSRCYGNFLSRQNAGNQFYLWFLVSSLESARTDFLCSLAWSIVVVHPLSRNSESLAFSEIWLAIDKFRCDTRFIAFGLGFAFTDGESSERPSWDLFDMTTLCLTCLSFGFGVNILDLNLGIRIDSVEQPIQRYSVCPRHMSHTWTSPLNNYFDHCFVVLKNVSTRCTMGRVCVHKNLIHIGQINMCGRHLLRFGCDLWPCYGLPWAGDHWVCITLCRTQDINYNVPQIKSGYTVHTQTSIQRYDFGFCRTVGCWRFLRIQIMETNVRLLKNIRLPPEVDFESSRPQQSLSLEKILIDNAVLCYPHWQY